MTEAYVPPWPEGEAINMPKASNRAGGGAATSWRSSPEREFLRCLTAALFKDRGLRGKALARAFKDLVPNYDDWLGEVTDKSIEGKGRNSWYYKSEHPDADPEVAPIYELARWVARQGKVVPDLREVLKHVGKVPPVGEAAAAEERPAELTRSEELTDAAATDEEPADNAIDEAPHEPDTAAA
jgi:hypothetical protein